MQAQRARGPEGQVLLSGTVQDVTVEQEYLRNADKYMAKKNTTLEILSHDLAGPFNMLQQLAGVFRRENPVPARPAGAEDDTRDAETCRDSVSLIRDFVDSEFMESASVELKPARVDLAASLRQVMDTYQQGEHLVAKHFALSQRAPRGVRGNRQQQVFAGDKQPDVQRHQVHPRGRPHCGGAGAAR